MYSTYTRPLTFMPHSTVVVFGIRRLVSIQYLSQTPALAAHFHLSIPVASAVSTCNSGFFASILPNCSIYIFLARTRGECTKNARPSWRVFVWLLFFLRLNRLQSNVVRCVVCASVLCCWLRAFVFSPSFFIFTKLYLSLSEVFVALLAGQFYAFYIRLYFVCFVTIVQLLNFIFIRYTRPSK